MFARRNRLAQSTVDAAPGEGRLSSVRTVSAGVWALDVVALAMSEIALFRARLAASEVRSRTAEVELAEARAVVSTSEAMIAHLRVGDRQTPPRAVWPQLRHRPEGPGSRMC